MPSYAFNGLVDYTISKGITPVFIGKRDFALKGKENNYFANVGEEMDFSKGIDFREKTTLLQAVEIIKGAKFILGIDNGLLHFAGCTETPIIFGHTITEVKHRSVRRPKGTVINLALTKESLPCSGCQSNMRNIIGHKFKNCIYDDYKCLDLLFGNEMSEWKRAIDYILGS
jgi:ADP-heptose:LPS heptosyltransferase